MTSPDDLRSAVARFRRARAELYLGQLAGAPETDPRLEADLRAPCAPERVQLYTDLAGVLEPGAHGALGAHMLRAQVERAVRSPRRAAAGWALRPAEASGRTASLAVHWSEPASFARPDGRDALLRATEQALSDLPVAQSSAQQDAATAAREAFAQLQPPRHADAGPEGGSAEQARAFLADSRDLAREAAQRVARESSIELRHAVDLFAALRCTDLAGFTREGRGHRAGELWAGLGMRDLLNRAVRLGAPHAAGWPAAQLIVRAAGEGVHIAQAGVEGGLCSELSLLEASGRALALASVSRALPLELRHPAVGTVARAFGRVATLGLAHPALWARHYGAGRAAARTLAQATAAYVLLRARLSASTLLVSGHAPEELSALASQALGVEVPPGMSAALLLRLSPGGDARAALAAPGLAAAVRERFDEDWLRNPRAAEPLLGACVRGGETSVETFVEELQATHKAGLSMLAELF